MIEIEFSGKFLREFKKLPDDLQEESHLKIGIFQKGKNTQELKIHKLNHPKRVLWSFSVTYKHRIVYEKVSSTNVKFVTIGDHDIYKNL